MATSSKKEEPSFDSSGSNYSRFNANISKHDLSLFSNLLLSVCRVVASRLSPADDGCVTVSYHDKQPAC